MPGCNCDVSKIPQQKTISKKFIFCILGLILMIGSFIYLSSNSNKFTWFQGKTKMFAYCGCALFFFYMLYMWKNDDNIK